MNEMSNIPAGGMTRRTGASTGSVSCIRTWTRLAEPRPGADRKPREDRPGKEDEQIDVQKRAENLFHERTARYSPRACKRSFSSSETSTFDGVSKKT